MTMPDQPNPYCPAARDFLTLDSARTTVEMARD